MEFSHLQDMITCLEYGTKLHIGVLFLGNFGNEKLSVSFENSIHSSPVCNRMKLEANGMKKCRKCRDMAIDKAIRSKTAFAGNCINGVYEYTRPVVIDGEVIGIIFIGNILPENAEKIKSRLKKTDKAELIETTQSGFGFENCDCIGGVIESYILALIEKYPSKKNYNAITENLKAYIEANIGYSIELKEIAKIFHYSEKYLGRLFKKEVGMSFNEYVNSRRINLAKKLLIGSDLSITDISANVGFNNVTYFNRVFKTAVGLPPGNYRKNS